MGYILAFLISFGASVLGAIAGFGGGVIIKPALDLFRFADVAAVSFLSGCTVLAMSCYSAGKSIVSREKAVDLKSATPLAAGAAVGGVLGKQMFSLVQNLSSEPDLVGAIQAGCLGIITLGTLIYTLLKSRIRTHHVAGIPPCLLIGAALGLISSFLGIGGGPINLVVLSYFFSMPTKTAASNSLYIIFFGQLFNLLTALVTGTVPEFAWGSLLLMASGGVLGGIAGRKLNRNMSEQSVERLFVLLISVIIIICIYNTIRFL